MAAENNVEIPRNTLYLQERHKAVRSLFKEYFKSLCQHLIQEHKEVQKLERQNKKTYQVKIRLDTFLTELKKYFIFDGNFSDQRRIEYREEREV